MFLLRFLGFLTVIGVVFLGVDYHQQSQKAKLKLGDLSADAYFATLGDRFASLEFGTGAGTRKRKLITYLPEASTGWQRDPWSRSLSKKLDTPRMPIESVGIDANATPPEEPDEFGLFTMGSGSGKKNTLIYQRSPEIVMISIRELSGNKLHERVAENMIKSTSEQNAFARLRGVVYVESASTFEFNGMSASIDGSETAPSTRQAVRRISGKLNNRIAISVKARASTQSIRQLLSKIDYDGLNEWLAEENEAVGNQVVNSLPQIEDSRGTPTKFKRERIQNATAAGNEPGFWDWIMDFFAS